MSKTISYAQWSLEPYCIGMKLRTLRTRKHMTLSRLATETGLSTALLSKIETDRMIPTLPTLATICRVYGVGLGYFFSEPSHHSLSVTRKAHLQSANRGAEAMTVTPLNMNSPQSRISARMIEFPAGGSGCPGGECNEAVGLVYVLEGKLQLDAGGMREQLDAGDCVYMDTELPTALSSAGKSRCRILAISPNAAN